jgi:ribonuclease P protein component
VIIKILADLSFPKSEKLTSKKYIQSVFRKGDNFYSYPLKFFFLTVPPAETSAKVQVLVSVPKRHFRKAVVRNRLKRQLREVHRLNKLLLLGSLEQLPSHYCINIIYIAKKKESFAMLNAAYMAFVQQIK